jgi:hypothetical protein
MGKETDEILQSCNLAREKMKLFHLETFTGIPLVIDDELEGMAYTIHISRKLYCEIKDAKMTQNRRFPTYEDDKGE